MNFVCLDLVHSIVLELMENMNFHMNTAYNTELRSLGYFLADSVFDLLLWQEIFKVTWCLIIYNFEHKGHFFVCSSL